MAPVHRMNTIITSDPQSQMSEVPWIHFAYPFPNTMVIWMLHHFPLHNEPIFFTFCFSPLLLIVVN